MKQELTLDLALRARIPRTSRWRRTRLTVSHYSNNLFSKILFIETVENRCIRFNFINNRSRKGSLTLFPSRTSQKAQVFSNGCWVVLAGVDADIFKVV